jgi:predicted DsbA family dithiol-disulfide isomerase
VRIERLKQEYGVRVKWIAFPLHPDTPEEGQTLEELFAGRPVDIPAMLARMKQVAGELGLPVCERARVYNSRRATELGKWAEAQGRGDAFHNALFRAYFAEGLNIAEVAVLKGICSGLDLDPGEAERVLVKGAYRKAVDDDWLFSVRLGVTAVPTFRVENRSVVGAQPYEVLERLITQTH